MTTVTRLDPTLPLVTPKGPAFAHFMITAGQEHYLYFVCFQQDSGECWVWDNRKVRLESNVTMGRGEPSKI